MFSIFKSRYIAVFRSCHVEKKGYAENSKFALQLHKHILRNENPKNKSVKTESKCLNWDTIVRTRNKYRIKMHPVPIHTEIADAQKVIVVRLKQKEINFIFVILFVHSFSRNSNL
jgi:hypothetical protein